MSGTQAIGQRPWAKTRKTRGGYALAALVLACQLASCATPQAQAIGRSAGQAWQRNECFKISDAQERGRCLASTSASYQEYERRSRAATANE